MNRVIRNLSSALTPSRGKAGKDAQSKTIPAPVPEVLAGGANSLKILYPYPSPDTVPPPPRSQVLPVEAPVPIGIRYLDSNNRPKANEPIHLEVAGYGSVYPADVITDQNGWAVYESFGNKYLSNVTLSKPGTLGTVASFEATLTATAKNNAGDKDQVVLQASTQAAGSPPVFTLDPTVMSLQPNSDHIDNGVWTLVTGTCLQADGTPGTFQPLIWDVRADPEGVLQPTVAQRFTFSDANGLFRNFVLTAPAAVDGTLTVTLNIHGLSKTYPCKAGATPIGTTTLDLTNEANFGQGVIAQLQATYTRTDNTSPDGKTVTWSSSPDAHLQSLTTTTQNGGRSGNTARPDFKFDPYTDAVWADVSDGGTIIRGVLVRNVAGAALVQTKELWTLTVDSPDGSVWTPGVPHDVIATLKDGSDPNSAKPLPDVPVTWYIWNPKENTLSQPYPTLTDAQGNATIQATVNNRVSAFVVASVVEASNNSYDGTSISAFFDYTVGTPPIEIAGGPSLPLYQQNPLTATYNVADNKQKSIEWLVDPQTVADGYHFVFTPNPSTTDNSGNTTTQLLAYGPELMANGATSATVFARTYNAGTGQYDLSNPLRLSFTQNAAPSDDGHIDLVSVDGDPLSEEKLHLIRATYTKLDGTPLPDVPVTWTPGSANVQLLSTLPTTTDENGVAVNGVTAITTSNPFDATITASATNPTTQKLEKTDLPLTFQATVAPSGSMTLKSKDDPPLAFNQPHDFTVTYLQSQNGPPIADNTPIYWAAYPADRISFADNPSYVAGGHGQSTNQVTASAGPDINNAQIWAWSPDIQTGVNDHADLSTRFAAPNTQNLFGVLIDKAYAQNLQLLVPPFPAQQLVKCQVQVLEQQGQQTVQLPTTPAAAAAIMYENNPPTYTPLQRNPDTGNYVLSTDSSGVGTFVVGATSYTMFDLNAQWQPPTGLLQTLASPAKLVIATNDQDGSATPPPSIPSATNGVLTIPPAPAPTFTVQVPSNKYTNYGGSQIALLLNDRMVYDGLASDAIKGAEVAYAALNLTGTNYLVYIARAGTPACAASVPFQFTTTGAPPQTGPNTGGVPRTIHTPPDVLVPEGATIGPRDIANGGLQVELSPYSQRAADDEVTMYFYLSGRDVLTGRSINNIVPIIPGDLSQLLGGQGIIVSLPQQYAAGYANGQLQVDYKVVNPNAGTRWSDLSPTYTLNTTF